MRRVTDFPYAIRKIDHDWIPTDDGIRLSASFWLPEGAVGERFPAVLECIPYRKRDMTAMRDQATHAYFAGHGYIGVRLDVRGTGDSEGIYADQFSPRYALDAAQVIAWIARQPWCNGQVAMFGLSWGAAIALQTAVLNPPELAAIICSAGIDDRYTLRFPGGCLTTATLSSIVAQMSYATRPPDPDIVGPVWRNMWMQRLDAAAPLTGAWLRDPVRGGGWIDNSLAADYGRITCPTLLSSGFADPAFVSAMLRTLERLEAPCEGIFGPWAHRYPHLGIPGPTIGYLQETLAFLGKWMSGAAATTSGRRMRGYLPSGFSVSETPVDRAGRWIGTSDWPGRAGAPRLYYLGRDGLAEIAQDGDVLPVPVGLLVSKACGEFMPLFGSTRGPELPGDQADDDAGSLVLDGSVLDRDLELIGIPEVTLCLDADAPLGHVVVRLCDVAPDGRSRRLSWGARNLALSDDLANKLDGLAGASGRTVTIPLYGLSDTVEAGHRLRIALSTSYWPLIWPPSRPGRLAIRTAGSVLSLPEWTGQGSGPVEMPPAEAANTLTWRENRPPRYATSNVLDPVTGAVVTTIVDDMGHGTIADLAISLSEVTTRQFRIHLGEPEVISLDTEISFSVEHHGSVLSTTIHGLVTSRPGGLLAEHSVKAREGNDIVFDRSWHGEF